MKVKYKYGTVDKYDGYMPNKPGLIHDNPYVSDKVDQFHIPRGWGYSGRRSRSGFRFGVEKRVFDASRIGFAIDGFSVGKTEM